MRVVAWFPAALVTALAFGTAVDSLAEAYGAGPPYYSCTTDMDKWTSPWPIVMIMTAACVGAIALTRWALRERSTVSV